MRTDHLTFPLRILFELNANLLHPGFNPGTMGQLVDPSGQSFAFVSFSLPPLSSMPCYLQV